MSTGYPPLDNPRMTQILRHAGVKVISLAPDRVVIRSITDDGTDPLTKLIRHLEPTVDRGHELTPSLDEMRAAGLIKDTPNPTFGSPRSEMDYGGADYGSLMMPGDGED